MTARADYTGVRWGFSTLGCAELNLQQVCELADAVQFAGIEIRALSGRMDLAEHAAEAGMTAESARAILGRHKTQLTVASSDFKLVGGSSEKSRANFARFCDWADSWNFPYVRAFGGGVWGDGISSIEINEAVDNLKWWRDEKESSGWRTDLLLETHDAFSASAPCLRLFEKLTNPPGIIWDTHHTWRLGGETPLETWGRLSQWIRHVHVKDSVNRPSARHPYTYVLPGAGEVPLEDIVGVLRTNNYRGVVSLEWERAWHPYLPPLNQALQELQLQKWF